MPVTAVAACLVGEACPSAASGSAHAVHPFEGLPFGSVDKYHLYGLVREGRPSDLAHEGHPSDLAREGHPSDLVREAHPSVLAHGAHPFGLVREGHPFQMVWYRGPLVAAVCCQGLRC